MLRGCAPPGGEHTPSGQVTVAAKVRDDAAQDVDRRHEVGGLDVLEHALVGLQVTIAAAKTAGFAMLSEASLPASSTTHPGPPDHRRVLESQARWRALNAPHLVALVRAGAWFEKGTLVERPDEKPGGDQQVA